MSVYFQMSLFGGSVWEWNDKRQQFYMHQFGKKQPDYDLRNEKVKQELKVSQIHVKD